MLFGVRNDNYARRLENFIAIVRMRHLLTKNYDKLIGFICESI